jgi:hypothetical protein
MNASRSPMWARRRPVGNQGVGGLNPCHTHPGYHPGPHAQIFFPGAKPLIIFFKSKKSNDEALLREPQCESLQALTRCVLGARRRDRWKSGIYFRSPSRWSRMGVRSSVDPGSRTAGLIRVQNREIKYRKPTRLAPMRPQGGLNLRRLSARDRVAGPHAFPRNSENIFRLLLAGRAGSALKKRRVIQGGGVGQCLPGI